MAEARDRGCEDLSEGFNQFRDEIESLEDISGEDFKAAAVTILQDLVDIQEDTMRRLMRLEEQVDNRLGVIESILEQIVKVYQQGSQPRTCQPNPARTSDM